MYNKKWQVFTGIKIIFIILIRSKKRPNMLQKNKLKDQLLTRKKVNVFQDKTSEITASKSSLLFSQL